MKKRMLSILLAACLLLTMAGCAAAGLEQRVDAAGERMEHRLDAAEDALEQAVRQTMAPPQEAPRQEAPPRDTPKQETPAPQPRISQEEAEKLALEHAGLKADQVQRLRTGFEIDDGIAQYDVEFLEGDWEYEFEINAEDGTILSYDRDHKFD